MASNDYSKRAGAAVGLRVTMAGVIILATLLWCALSAAASQGDGNITVSATCNIWGAGHAAPPSPGGGGGGILPFEIPLPPGIDRTVTFPGVTGSVVYGFGFPPNGPDGIETTCGEQISWDGIAGMYIYRGRFLAGVFLDALEPSDPAPEKLDFTGGIGFAEVSPGIAQTFFIGDGLTGTGGGEVQVFHVPPDATRLFLGFFDHYGCMEPPGGYGDNSGSLEVTFELAGICPADINGDGVVDVLDLLQLLAAWGNTSGPEDINGDGVVDVLDLLEILAAWGPC